jgi:hypothetical protein
MVRHESVLRISGYRGLKFIVYIAVHIRLRQVYPLAQQHRDVMHKKWKHDHLLVQKYQMSHHRQTVHDSTNSVRPNAVYRSHHK